MSIKPAKVIAVIDDRTPSTAAKVRRFNGVVTAAQGIHQELRRNYASVAIASER